MILQNIRPMPAPLLIMICVFFLLPFWSLTFVELPWEIFARGDILGAGVVAFAYFVGPLLILLTTALRNIAFLPIFVFECLALILHSVLNFQNQAVEFQFLRYVMLGAMAASGMFVFNRDTLYPFMAKNARFWRRSQRITTNAKMHLLVNDARHPVMLQDISLTGMGLIGSSPEVLAALKVTGKDGSMLFSIRQEGQDLNIEGKLSWKTGHGDTRQFGVRVADPAAMAKVIGRLQLNSGASKFSQFVVKNWARTGFRRTVLSVWGLTLAGSLGVPACGKGGDSTDLGVEDSRLGHSTSGEQSQDVDSPLMGTVTSKMQIKFDDGWVEIPSDDPENITPFLRLNCGSMNQEGNHGTKIHVFADETCPVFIESILFDGLPYTPQRDDDLLVFYLKSQGNSLEILAGDSTKTYYPEGFELQSQGGVTVGVGLTGITVQASPTILSAAVPAPCTQSGLGVKDQNTLVACLNAMGGDFPRLIKFIANNKTTVCYRSTDSGQVSEAQCDARCSVIFFGGIWWFDFLMKSPDTGSHEIAEVFRPARTTDPNGGYVDSSNTFQLLSGYGNYWDVEKGPNDQYIATQQSETNALSCSGCHSSHQVTDAPNPNPIGGNPRNETAYQIISIPHNNILTQAELKNLKNCSCADPQSPSCDLSTNLAIKTKGDFASQSEVDLTLGLIQGPEPTDLPGGGPPPLPAPIDNPPGPVQSCPGFTGQYDGTVEDFCISVNPDPIDNPPGPIQSCPGFSGPYNGTGEDICTSFTEENLCNNGPEGGKHLLDPNSSVLTECVWVDKSPWFNCNPRCEVCDKGSCKGGQPDEGAGSSGPIQSCPGFTGLYNGTGEDICTSFTEENLCNNGPEGGKHLLDPKSSVLTECVWVDKSPWDDCNSRCEVCEDDKSCKGAQTEEGAANFDLPPGWNWDAWLDSFFSSYMYAHAIDCKNLFDDADPAADVLDMADNGIDSPDSCINIDPQLADEATQVIRYLPDGTQDSVNDSSGVWNVLTEPIENWLNVSAEARIEVANADILAAAEGLINQATGYLTNYKTWREFRRETRCFYSWGWRTCRAIYKANYGLSARVNLMLSYLQFEFPRAMKRELAKRFSGEGGILNAALKIMSNFAAAAITNALKAVVQGNLPNAIPFNLNLNVAAKVNATDLALQLYNRGRSNIVNNSILGKHYKNWPRLKDWFLDRFVDGDVQSKIISGVQDFGRKVSKYSDTANLPGGVILQISFEDSPVEIQDTKIDLKVGNGAWVTVY